MSDVKNRSSNQPVINLTQTIGARKNLLSISITSAVLFAVSASAAAEDLTVNRMLAAQCAQCHGTDGRAYGGMEELAGEDFQEMFNELLEMKFDQSESDIMAHQAMGYSDDQLRRIAEYYSSLSVYDSDDEEEQEHEEEEDVTYPEAPEEPEEPEEPEAPEEPEEPESETPEADKPSRDDFSSRVRRIRR